MVATGLCGTDELRFSADGTQLLVAETGADHLTRCRVGPDATLSGRVVYGPAQLGQTTEGAFDVEGNLWTTLICCVAPATYVIPTSL